jgi:hypothetical protein
MAPKTFDEHQAGARKRQDRAQDMLDDVQRGKSSAARTHDHAGTISDRNVAAGGVVENNSEDLHAAMSGHRRRAGQPVR